MSRWCEEEFCSLRAGHDGHHTDGRLVRISPEYVAHGFAIRYGLRHQISWEEKETLEAELTEWLQNVEDRRLVQR